MSSPDSPSSVSSERTCRSSHLYGRDGLMNERSGLDSSLNSAGRICILASSSTTVPVEPTFHLQLAGWVNLMAESTSEEDTVLQIVLLYTFFSFQHDQHPFAPYLFPALLCQFDAFSEKIWQWCGSCCQLRSAVLISSTTSTIKISLVNEGHLVHLLRLCAWLQHWGCQDVFLLRLSKVQAAFKNGQHCILHWDNPSWHSLSSSRQETTIKHILSRHRQAMAICCV